MSDEANVYLRGDEVCYRASALGSCVRALVAARMGMTPMDPPEDMQRRFADGHLHEGAVLSMLGQEVNVRDSQETVTLPVMENVIITGHLDATATGRLDAWEAAGVPITPNIMTNTLDDELHAGVEVKSFAMSTWDKWLSQSWLAFPYYANQVSIYMEATGLPFLFAVKNKNNGRMNYTWVLKPPADINAIKEKVKYIEGLVVEGTLPDCDQRDYPCPFWYMCTEREMLPEQTVIDTAVDALGATVMRKRREKKMADEAAAEARQRLLDLMGDRRQVATDSYRVSIQTQERRTTDWTRLLEEHPEIRREDYEKVSSHDTLYVKEQATNDQPDTGNH